MTFIIHSFIRRFRQVSIERVSMFGKNKNKDIVVRYDLVMKVCLCKQHKDFCSPSGKLSKEVVLQLIAYIRHCPNCKVGYEL